MSERLQVTVDPPALSERYGSHFLYAIGALGVCAEIYAFRCFFDLLVVNSTFVSVERSGPSRGQ